MKLLEKKFATTNQVRDKTINDRLDEIWKKLLAMGLDPDTKSTGRGLRLQSLQ
jgi:hypothetical protein